jgi:guanylate kinase
MKRTIQEELDDQGKRSVFLVLTGPSGAGKDTVLPLLQEKLSNVARIITTTSRPPRPGESEGNPYHFVSRDEFEKRIADHRFFEWVEFRGNLYGTQKDEIEKGLNSGADVVLKIETKGVKNIKEKVRQMTNRSVFVFISTRDIKTLEERVKKSDNGDDVNRWNEPLVAWEMEQFDDFDYLVDNENGELDKTVDKIRGIIETKRLEIIK